MEKDRCKNTGIVSYHTTQVTLCFSFSLDLTLILINITDIFSVSFNAALIYFCILYRQLLANAKSLYTKEKFRYCLYF